MSIAARSKFFSYPSSETFSMKRVGDFRRPTSRAQLQPHTFYLRRQESAHLRILIDRGHRRFLRKRTTSSFVISKSGERSAEHGTSELCALVRSSRTTRRRHASGGTE